MKDQKTQSAEEDDLPGYPVYPESEDIYNNELKVEDINPDSISERMLPNLSGNSNDQVLDEFIGERDLDIPGSELDDEQESIGTEDEENNYYSLGGDNHENLEENNEGF